MATLNDHGNIIANCPGCEGAKSTFEYRRDAEQVWGVVTVTMIEPLWFLQTQYRLFRCAGCGRGALATIAMQPFNPASGGGGQLIYPSHIEQLISFFPESIQPLNLPDDVPDGIRAEFREAEKCLGNQCFRAATALFRSVLDKTMRANGYKTYKIDLYKQIEAAADDGVLTQARKLRAHEDIRVLGNDVLHDEWREISEEDVEPAHHYAQRILEDFYDDRPTVLAQLRKAGRIPDEDKPKAP
ncbi:MAG TPA: DUF4145 domain-containing protein [Gemmataceae bacterium]|nr:DUF4145 domain-containing protein [Gemmataceae bacterium]